ncbi:lysozyme [Anabrus simplex]|uniref:lysozyme n=1 Tax=Anabrus simplex TaxID=316456 RepID=UPI0035A2E206
MARLTLLLVLAGLLAAVSAKKFTTACQIARELKKHDFAGKDLANWVCLVQSESSGDSSKKGGPNKNGSYDYGLFQINSKYWCKNGVKGGDCNIKCEDLLNDDLSDDSQCAHKIYKRHGFTAWYGWRNKCQNNLPDISKC